MTQVTRCGWVSDDPLYIAYHDEEWGRPVRDSRALFELLCLEGQQAGLSWITVLKKRENYRKQFHDFDPQKMARMTADDVERLLQDSGLIRHRGKIEALIGNARIWLALKDEGVDFSEWLWSFVEGQPVVNRWQHFLDAPTSTAQSDAMSKALKKRGFKFVGSTICYAFMQAAGMVNDHTTDCFCYSAK